MRVISKQTLQMRIHHPADDAPRPDIEHDRQVQEPSPGRHVSDVRHPQPIWSFCGELPIDQIGWRDPRSDQLAWCARKRAAYTPRSPAERISRATRLRPTCVACSSASSAWIDGAPYAPRERRWIAWILAREADVRTRPCRQRTTVPGIEAALGHLEQTAHDPYRMGGLVRLHESEERFAGSGSPHPAALTPGARSSAGTARRSERDGRRPRTSKGSMRRQAC